MSSKLIAETDTTITVEAYIHSSNDEYDSWQLDKDGNSIYGDYFDSVWHHMLDEWLLTLVLDKKTGRIIEVVGIR